MNSISMARGGEYYYPISQCVAATNDARVVARGQRGPISDNGIGFRWFREFPTSRRLLNIFDYRTVQYHNKRNILFHVSLFYMLYVWKYIVKNYTFQRKTNWFGSSYFPIFCCVYIWDADTKNGIKFSVSALVFDTLFTTLLIK